MIYTSYFANIRHLPKNSLLISIARFQPNALNLESCNAVAPPLELLRHWKTHADQEYYIKYYTEHVLNRIDAKKFEEYLLRRQAETGTDNVFLLCYETPVSFCHRHLLSQFMREHGVNCCEWTNE